MPSYEIAIDWDDDETYGYDETALVTDVHIRRGRSDELGPAEMGTCVLYVKNDDGRFTPENSSSALFGKLEPYRRVRVRATDSVPTTYDLFHGFITSIQPDPTPPGMCTIRCADVFLFMRAFHLNEALSQNDLTGARLQDVLTTMGLTSADWDLDAGQTTLDTSYWRNSDVLTAVHEITDHELGGLTFIGRDGKVTFHDRHARANEVSQGTITNAASIRYDRRDDQIYRQAILQAGGFDEQPAGVIWSHFPLPVAIAPGATLVLDPNYNQPATAVTTPVSGTHWIANASADGTGADKTSALASDFENYGGGAKWRLGPNTDAATVYLQAAYVEGTPLGLSTGLRSVERSSSGGVGPFDKTFQRGYPFITDSALLGDWADYIVEHFDEPRPKATVVQYARDATAETNILKSEIGQRWTLQDTAFAYSSMVNGDFFIEQIEHRVNLARHEHETTWLMTDFLADQFWVLGVSELGVDTILGY